MSHKEKPVLLLGSYGRGNIGDDVFLLAALELFHQRKIYINSANDELLPSIVKGKITTIQTTGIGDFYKKLKLFLSVKSIVYWGGDVWVKWYENKWQTQPLYQMIVLNLIARMLGKKIYYVGCGIGNLRGYSLFLARLSARMAKQIAVRESRSQQVLSLGNTSVLPDLAVNLPYYQPRLHSLPNKNQKFIVGISILYYVPNPKQEFNKLVNNLVKLIESTPKDTFEFVLLPMLVSKETKNDDLWASNKILEKLVGQQNNVNVYVANSLEDMVQKLGTCHLIIGSRLHTNILATFNATPCIGIAYRPKVSSFFKDNNLDKYFVTLENANKLSQMVSEIHADYSNVAKLFYNTSTKNLKEKATYQEIINLI